MLTATILTAEDRARWTTGVLVAKIVVVFVLFDLGTFLYDLGTFLYTHSQQMIVCAAILAMIVNFGIVHELAMNKFFPCHDDDTIITDTAKTLPSRKPGEFIRKHQDECNEYSSIDTNITDNETVSLDTVNASLSKKDAIVISDSTPINEGKKQKRMFLIQRARETMKQDKKDVDARKERKRLER